MSLKSLQKKARISLKQGNFSEAEKLYKEMLIASPENAEAWFALGTLAEKSKQIPLALHFTAKAMELAPNCAAYYGKMGKLLLEVQHNEEAMALLKKAIALAPRDPEIHYHYALALQRLQFHEEALNTIHYVIRLSPKLAAAHYTLGTLLQEKGHYPDARDAYQTALSLGMHQPTIYRMLSSMKRYNAADMPEITHIEKTLKQLSEHSLGAAELHFTLGKCYDDLQIFDQAFHHYQKGNQILNTQYTFKSEPTLQKVQKDIAFLNKEFFKDKMQLGDPSEAPIFIIGLPRSGTSLVEQILSGHPSVYGMGEDLFFIRAINHLPQLMATTLTYPEILSGFSPSHSEIIVTQYLKKCEALKGPAQYIINKLPSNFEIIGFLHLLFPNAKFIHCQRHLLDNALSIYFQRFDTSHLYANDFNHIACYFRIHHLLMEHWKHTLPQLKLHSISYENLIEKPEETCKSLFAFCNLEWDSAYLEFQKNQKTVNTASHWQVRQPLYRHAMQRWKNYEPFISELVTLMDRAIIL